MTNEPKTGMTTLEREVLNFVIIISSIMLFMIILVIVVWFVDQYNKTYFMLFVLTVRLGPHTFESHIQTG